MGQEYNDFNDGGGEGTEYRKFECGGDAGENQKTGYVVYWTEICVSLDFFYCLKIFLILIFFYWEKKIYINNSKKLFISNFFKNYS